MSDVIYQNPRAAPAPVAENADVFRYQNPRAVKDQHEALPPESHKLRTALITAAGAGAAGLTAYGATKMFRWMLPGQNPTRALINGLDKALKTDNKDYGLREATKDWVAHVNETGKPVSIADFLSRQNSRNGPNTMSFLNTVLNNSKVGKPIRDQLDTRLYGTVDRVNADLAKHLGVTPQSLQELDDEMKATRSANAAPLYAAAFKNKNALVDSRSLELGKKYPDELNNALNAYYKSSAEDVATAVARDPTHKLFWKNPVSPKDVPEVMAAGDEAAKAQRYYQPTTEEWHHIRENLWKMRTGAKAQGDYIKADRYKEAWKAVTDFMDKAAPDEYKAARQQFKTDSDILNAKDIGTELANMDPRDARAAVLNMSPEERAALGRGFMSSMSEDKNQKNIRQYIAKPEEFPKQNANLQLVFDHPKNLESFLNNLEGERSLYSGSTGLRINAPAESTPDHNLSLRVGSYLGMHSPFAAIRDTEMLRPARIPSNPNVAAKGADMLFHEPKFANGAEDSLLGPLSRHDTFDNYPLEAISTTAGAGLGGAAGYGFSGPLGKIFDEEPQ